MLLEVNSKLYHSKAKTLFALRDELGFSKEFIILYKGFAVTTDLTLNENDNIIFMDKNAKVEGELLKQIMRARNSPQLNAALDKACIGIAGLGGLGSSVAIALARVGIAKLVLVDFDTVDASNLNRQQYFLSDIGKKKTQALAKTISLINPFVEVITKDIYLDENNVNDVFSSCLAVAECFDNAKSKAMIINTLKRPLVAASGIAGYGRSQDIKITQFSKNIWICGDLKDAAGIGNGLMAPRVGIAAMMQANLILELIANQS